MVIGERKFVMPQDINFLTNDAIKLMFADRSKLNSSIPNSFAVYIEVQVWQTFLQFADDAYKIRRHEASGIFLGYYFKDMIGEYSVCTHFEPGTGTETGSTFCEISINDQARIASIANENNLLQLVWVHTHPAFGAFYSQVDYRTLKTSYYAPHQAGLVVDNIAHEYEGFKTSQENHVSQFKAFYLIDFTNSNKQIANPLGFFTH